MFRWYSVPGEQRGPVLSEQFGRSGYYGVKDQARAGEHHVWAVLTPDKPHYSGHQGEDGGSRDQTDSDCTANRCLRVQLRALALAAVRRPPTHGEHTTGCVRQAFGGVLPSSEEDKRGELWRSSAVQATVVSGEIFKGAELSFLH